MAVLAGLDLLHVPAGLATLDAVCKEARVELLLAGDIDPGRFLIVFGGDLADVEVALGKGIAAGADALLESLLLPYAHDQLLAALRGTYASADRVLAEEHALGTLHGHTPLTVLAAVDRALKAADVGMLRLRLASELAGQGHAVFAGQQEDVEAALLAANGGLPSGVVLQTRVIARPAPEVVAAACQRRTGPRTVRALEP